MRLVSATAAGALTLYALPAGLVHSPAAPLVGVHRRLSARDAVALTFDDGPQPGVTDRFLELLARLDVRATFFLVGEQVQRCPALVREIQAAGHEIANHGFQHRNHLLRDPRRVPGEIRRGAEAIAAVTGRWPDLFRPPQGAVTAVTRLAALRQRADVVMWTACGHDWRRRATPRSVTRDVLSDSRGGAIILLHDADYYRLQSWQVTFDAVPTIVTALREQALAIGPVGGPDGLA